MTHYSPCLSCRVPSDTCQRRQQIRKSISGLSITSLKFKCPDRDPLFHPGQRISVGLMVSMEQLDEYGSSEINEVEFHGTVLHESRRKNGCFVVRIDRGPSYEDDEVLCPDHLLADGFISISAKRLRLLKEPKRYVCETCSAVLNDDQCDWTGITRPTGCFGGLR